MLIGIDPILGPDILHGLRAMGHGDELVIADGSFPAETVARRLVRMEAADLESMLRGGASVLPIDDSEPDPVLGMEVIGNPAEVMLGPHPDPRRAGPGSRAGTSWRCCERFAFYERAEAGLAA